MNKYYNSSVWSESFWGLPEGQGGKVLQSGCLDAGYPVPGKIRQAQFVIPNTTDWKD